MQMQERYFINKKTWKIKGKDYFIMAIISGEKGRVETN